MLDVGSSYFRLDVPNFRFVDFQVMSGTGKDSFCIMHGINSEECKIARKPV
jgi:hypothetical protein